jgi:hypothetical protein
MHGIDSLDAVYGLLSFLSLSPGDHDREYFDEYTPKQLAWAQSIRCEELQMMVYDYEKRNR